MESKIRTLLEDLGFDQVGFLSREDALFEDWIDDWLKKGRQADMKWLEQNRDLRVDPCSIMEGSRSIITLAFRYGTEPPEGWEENNPISNFAWGEDYHLVLKKKLKTAIATLKDVIPGFEARGFVDTAPIPEKVVAAHAGLGWIGKNSLLIHPKRGSYFFLAEIVCNLDLPSGTKMEDRCGSCELCIKHCPTGAICKDGTVDARKCASYLTIEKEGSFGQAEERLLTHQIFGCDVCQQVCPWNRSLTEPKDSPFRFSEKWQNMDLQDYMDLGLEEFEKLKIKSPIKRAGLENIKRNAQAVIENKQTQNAQ